LLRGADVNATTPNGMTPLLLAALQRHTLVATVLLHARADPHKANHQGNTAMFFAR
jgi:ankyrin repeat protein